jgi:hypothetical protein
MGFDLQCDAGMTTKSRNVGRSAPSANHRIQSPSHKSTSEVSGEEVLNLDPVEQQLENVLSDVVPPNELSKTKRDVLRVFEQHESYHGPIPPPALFRQFEEILPGVADRILRMAEKEQDHRIE